MNHTTDNGRCYMCGKDCECWHVSATHRMRVCDKCMRKYRTSLSTTERRRDMIIHFHHGKVYVNDLTR